MKYYVTYRIDARYIAEVEADSLEEAKKKPMKNGATLILAQHKTLMES